MSSNTKSKEEGVSKKSEEPESDSSEDEPERVLTDVTFEGVVNYMKSGKCKHIITMAGAGISTSAGIPDFRSPGTGLYDNLEKFNLPSPHSVFEIDYFDENPEPFFQLARELWPGKLTPTPAHFFVRLLHDKGLLLRHYTQNIDTLEYLAGIPADKIVEAHGSFHHGHCRKCGQEYDQEWLKVELFKGDTVSIPQCVKDGCDGIVKPDVVFFGEALPQRFFQLVKQDLPKCDLLIIMGTSLKVQPFAMLPHNVPESCPRLYINLENSTVTDDPFLNLLMGLSVHGGFRFGKEGNYRDIFKQGTCDSGVMEMMKLLGWEDDFKKFVQPIGDEEASNTSEGVTASPK